jgi:glycogen(starch) synthase
VPILFLAWGPRQGLLDRFRRRVAPRVLILSWEYPPIVEGGLARHVRKLSEALVRDGATVHVLTRGREGDPPEEVRAGVRVHRVPETAMPRDLDAFVAWIEAMNDHMLASGRALLERGGFDVVHGHDWLVARAAAALAAAAGAPYLTTVHATEYGRHQGWVDKHPQSYIHGVETWMARRADHVIACSHYMRGHVADVFGVEEAKVSVIPNGIDPGDLVPVADLETLRARFAAPEQKLVLLVGRLVYEKGFQLALEALGGRSGVIRRVPGVRFLVAGSGTHEDELKAQARRLGLWPHGTFMGWIGDDMLHSLYRIADLCVVPSIYEPFGLVALEAMASGCPCIVADTGGLREVVPNSDVGLRFRSRDPRSLARMMVRVLTDDALRDGLVAEASGHVLGFDWADVAAQTADVYAALRRPGTHPGARRSALARR